MYRIYEIISQKWYKHEHNRLCVILAKSEGTSVELIAQAHRISTDSVYRYLAEWSSVENGTTTQEGEVKAN